MKKFLEGVQKTWEGGQGHFEKTQTETDFFSGWLPLSSSPSSSSSTLSQSLLLLEGDVFSFPPNTGSWLSPLFSRVRQIFPWKLNQQYFSSKTDFSVETKPVLCDVEKRMAFFVRQKYFSDVQSRTSGLTDWNCVAFYNYIYFTYL